jgi:hypothetical protein
VVAAHWVRMTLALYRNRAFRQKVYRGTVLRRAFDKAVSPAVFRFQTQAESRQRTRWDPILEGRLGARALAIPHLPDQKNAPRLTRFRGHVRDLFSIWRPATDWFYWNLQLLSWDSNSSMCRKCARIPKIYSLDSPIPWVFRNRMWATCSLL